MPAGLHLSHTCAKHSTPPTTSTYFVGGFIIGFIHDWQLALLMCAMAPPMAISGAVIMSSMATAEAKEQEIYAHAGALAQERLASIRTVQACGRQEEAVAKYLVHLKKARTVLAAAALRSVLTTV